MNPVINNIVIACPDGTWSETDRRRWVGIPQGLVLFYAELLGMKTVREAWVKIGWEDGRRPLDTRLDTGESVHRKAN